MTVHERVRPGYRQTDAGLMPVNWTLSPIADLGSNSRPVIKAGPFGSAIKKENYVESGYKIYGQEQVIRGDHLFGDYYVDRKKFQQLESCSVRPGDILLSLVGTTGKVLLVPEGAPSGIINPRLLRLSFDSSRVLSLFFKYVAESDYFQLRLERSAQGGTMGVLNAGTIKPIEVMLPPLPEQRAIAAALSDADALIASLDALIAKKRDLQAAAMQQLLTGKIRLPEFTGEWRSLALGSISAFITKGATPTTYGYKWQSDGIRFLRSECVSETGLDLSQSMFISVDAHEGLKRGEVQSGDLLITITGNVGRVIHLEKTFGIANINQHIARIRITSAAADAGFIYQQLRQPIFRRYFNSIVTGQAYPQISLKQVRDTIISLPTLGEQQAINAILSDLDAELTALESKRDKARVLKQGMMQELLTGRIRLI